MENRGLGLLEKSKPCNFEIGDVKGEEEGFSESKID